MTGGLIYLAVTILTVIPLMKLLPAHGFNPWWSLAALRPFGVLALLWLMAARVRN